MKECLLPDCCERNAEIDMLVLHCSAYPAAKAIETYREAKVSAHYIIDENGEIIRLVDEAKAAYHAGVGFWRGRTDSCNMRSVGIELVNMSLGQTPYSEAQIAALIPLCKELMQKYRIATENVVGHSDIKPLGKADPGMCFPWQRLAQEGIGLWYNPADAEKTEENNASVLLAKVGYNTADEETTIASAYAFRRRFLPEEVRIDNDVMHLVDNVYPVGDKSLLSGEKFINCLKAVAYRYETLENSSKGYTLINGRQNPKLIFPSI
ncbi:MAG: N-acetylmuramoyl-L-alanine amidase [Alphaproteobacteria bacterium]|nr:N-acetylmuramoyl-L-alanine amidase [Alphaproteobacteria bacterium]